ncbi:MAG: hypothetical protein PHY48_16310 [Candidatus Cloacimonetes bacterium]|nr:hypothetical protein [Candidatus Cloacimonadota bacterium]
MSAKATEIWTGIANFLGQIWDKIKMIFEFGAQLATGIVVMAFNSMGIDIVGIWNAAWLAINSIVQTVSGTLKTIIGGLWSWLQTSFKTISEPLSALWRGLWDGIGNTVSGVLEGVKSTIKGFINWMVEQINSIIRSINGIAAKGASTLGMKSISIPTIPALAEGGIVTRPTLALIGEAGPEAVVPLSRGRSAGAGTVFNVYITGNQYMNEREFEKMLNKITVKSGRLGLAS